MLELILMPRQDCWVACVFTGIHLSRAQWTTLAWWGTRILYLEGGRVRMSRLYLVALFTLVMFMGPRFLENHKQLWSDLNPSNCALATVDHIDSTLFYHVFGQIRHYWIFLLMIDNLEILWIKKCFSIKPLFSNFKTRFVPSIF